MRESFDLPGVPIRIFIKSNKNPYADEAEGNRSVKNTKIYPTKRKITPMTDPEAVPELKRAMNREAAAEVAPAATPTKKVGVQEDHVLQGSEQDRRSQEQGAF